MISHRIVVPLLALLLTGAGPQERSPQWQGQDSERPGGGRPPRGDDLLRGAMLKTHERARREASITNPAMLWDTGLAAAATDYARQLSRSGKLEHSDHATRNPPQGENLWKGTLDYYRYEDMAGHWVQERRFYDGRPVTRERLYQAGHYIQIIWSDSTHLGCGMASNATHDVLVCRYAPPGNWLGEEPRG